MKVTFARLDGLPSVGESIRNDFDYTSYVLGGVLFLWRLSIASLLVVSLSYSFFCSISSSVCVVIPMLILLVSSGSRSYLVVVRPFNKLD